MDGEFIADTFKVRKLDLDLVMTLNTTVHSGNSITNKLWPYLGNFGLRIKWWHFQGRYIWPWPSNDLDTPIFNKYKLMMLIVCFLANSTGSNYSFSIFRKYNFKLDLQMTLNLTFLYKRGKIPNNIGIVISFGITYTSFIISRQLIILLTVKWPWNQYLYLKQWK